MAEENFDAAVRRADPDRWLAARFIADPAARADVLALYAFDAELARARHVASNALIAEIRLAWWLEVLDEIFAGGPVRLHPLAQALAGVIARRGLPRAALEAMADGHAAILSETALTLETAEAWAGAVAGSAAVLAARILDPGAPADAAAPAGRLWGLMVLARQGLIDPALAAARLRSELSAAGRAARTLGPAAFPAVAQAALVRDWGPGRRQGPLGQRLRLTWAVASGRL